MNWFSDIFVILISFLLMILGKKKMIYESGLDKTVGLTFIVLSFLSIVYFLINISHNFRTSDVFKIGFMIFAILIWLTLLCIPSKFVKHLKDKFMTLVTLSLFVYWIIAKDFIFSLSDSVLFLGFVFLLLSQFPRRFFGVK